ncbi:uncharacterized protein LOC108216396 isoform X3 [Daucus carota subsp. sativus]|uniref:uncharacterized protein LOC108216396 isoform X3 n=1 Tax=Daucus carota subsp. sativus TaxID=79200 RepID=UPI003083E174
MCLFTWTMIPPSIVISHQEICKCLLTSRFHCSSSYLLCSTLSLWNLLTGDLQVLVNEMPNEMAKAVKEEGNLQVLINEMAKAVKEAKAVKDKSTEESLLMEWQNDCTKLEEMEKSLSSDYNQVLSNLYLLPGYVLAVAAAVSSLLGSEPQHCWLFCHIVVIVFIYLLSMCFAFHLAYKQLKIFGGRKAELGRERTRLHEVFLANGNSFRPHTRSVDLLFRKLQSFQTENVQLKYQNQGYFAYMVLSTVCGLLFSSLLFYTGFYRLCRSQDSGDILKVILNVWRRRRYSIFQILDRISRTVTVGYHECQWSYYFTLLLR